MRERAALRKLKRGDPEGLQELMELYTPYVSAVVWGVLRDVMTAEDCEEVVSDVFLAAWARRDTLLPGKCRPWLGAAARNLAKNKRRGLRQTLPLEDDALELPAPEGPQEVLTRAEEARRVRRAVDALPPEDREIFLRHYFYFQTVEEIAAGMELNPSTVKTRLRRGREKLKQSLTEEGPEDETQHIRSVGQLSGGYRPGAANAPVLCADQGADHGPDSDE